MAHKTEGSETLTEEAEFDMAALKESGRYSEKRRVPRIPVNFPVTVALGRKQHRCEAKELSEYGILVATPSKDLVGQEVQIRLSLNPNESPLAVEGVVVYGTDTSIGIRFKNVPREEQQILRSYAHAHGIGIGRPQS